MTASCRAASVSYAATAVVIQSSQDVRSMSGRHGPAARKERDVHRVAIRSDRAAQDMELVRHPGESVEQQDCLAARPGDPDVIAQADHRPMVGP